MSKRTPNKSAFCLGWDQEGEHMLLMTTVATAQTGFPRTRDVHATPASLIPAGSAKPIKFCSSGWRPQTEPYDILANDKWTELVRQFSAVVGFRLGSHIRDVQNTNDPELRVRHAGRFLACHAEKKLGLFFLTQQMRFAGVSLQDALQGHLRLKNLPMHRRKAKIVLGHKPCKNCLNFLGLIRRKTGIDVGTESCDVFARKLRKRAFYESQAKQQDGARQAVVPAEEPRSHDESEQDEETGKKQGAQEIQGIPGRQDRDGGGSRASDSSPEADPIHFSARRSCRRAVLAVPSEDADGEDDRSVQEADCEAEPEPENGLPSLQPVLCRMSVLSTPSPSISAASIPGSSPLPRRLRFTPYSASPPRIGGTGAPPAHWGPRGKPPPTPCFVAPASWESNACEASREAANQASIANTRSLCAMEVLPSSRASSSVPSTGQHVSHFFATESPEPRTASQVELSAPDHAQGDTSRRTADSPKMTGALAPALAPVENSAPASFVSLSRKQQQRQLSRAERCLPPPPQRRRPITPVRNESADVEFVLSMSAGRSTTRSQRMSSKSPTTIGRAAAAAAAAPSSFTSSSDVQLYVGQGQWQPAPATATSAAPRPLGMTPDRNRRHARLGRSLGAHLHLPGSSRPSTASVIDLTAPKVPTALPSSSSVFVRRPHPMPIVTSNMGRPLRKRNTSTRQQQQQQQQKERRQPQQMLHGFRAAVPGMPRQALPFPDLQSYRFEV